MMRDLIGQQLGNYRLVKLLGRGGFAEVYLGQHVRLSTQAAIKVLHAHLSEEQIKGFEQEAETIAALIHPHIVRILDFDITNGLPSLLHPSLLRAVLQNILTKDAIDVGKHYFNISYFILAASLAFACGSHESSFSAP